MKPTLYCLVIIVVSSIYVTSCVNNEIPEPKFDCTKSDLAASLVSKLDATSCKSIDGSITVLATGGLEPYNFSLGNGVYQTNPVFEKLAPGSYLITAKDKNGCKVSVAVDLAAANSTLSATASTTLDDQCFTDNGTITVVPTGGTPPYQAKIDNGVFGTTLTFQNQGDGSHSIIVKDNTDCERVLQVTVPRGSTGISYASTIVPIFVASCNFSGCHGAGSSGRDWTKFADVSAKASQIKSRTSNRSMPIGSGPSLSDTQIKQIACWVDDGAPNN